MTASEKIHELLLKNGVLTTRQITDRMVSDGFRWPRQVGTLDHPETRGVTFDRVHNKLIAMLLKGQVRRKKSMGVWVWRLP